MFLSRDHHFRGKDTQRKRPLCSFPVKWVGKPIEYSLLESRFPFPLSLQGNREERGGLLSFLSRFSKRHVFCIVFTAFLTTNLAVFYLKTAHF